MSASGPGAGAAGLTIREVVARTGVEAATLRIWEQRYGFPVPERLPSGHRRYSQTDVERIRQVVRDRDGGLALRAAVLNAKRAAGEGRPVVEDESVYAALRRRRPELLPYVLPKSTLVALAHAIEDECCAHAQRGLLFASFQRERFFRHAEERWRELSRTADAAAVMADFDELREPEGGPVEVPIGRTDPIGREWSLICDAPGFGALLSAWERPGQEGVSDPRRAFETLWSVEPELVRDASVVATSIIRHSAPALADRIEPRLEQPVEVHGDRIRLLSALTNRMVAYVGGTEVSRFPAPHSS